MLVKINNVTLNETASKVFKAHETLADIADGSEKQNDWAWSIRCEFYHQVMSNLNRVPAEQADAFAAGIQECFNSQVSCKFWIDNRGMDWKSVLKALGYKG